jgi:HK97 family phage major capsid protein
MYQVEANNGVLTGWVAHPILKNKLRQLKDGNGNYIYVPGAVLQDGQLVEMPTLMGLPIRFTTQIPITSRPSSNETYLIGGNWGEYAIATKGSIRVEVSREASDSSGYAFVDDQIWIKAVERIDAAPLQPKQFVVVKGWSVA